jgi:hypothetical protein
MKERQGLTLSALFAKNPQANKNLGIYSKKKSTTARKKHGCLFIMS